MPSLAGNWPSGLFRPCYAPLSHFERGLNSTWETQKTNDKGLVPQFSSDSVKPPSLKASITAAQFWAHKEGGGTKISGEFQSCFLGMRSVVTTAPIFGGATSP